MSHKLLNACCCYIANVNERDPHLFVALHKVWFKVESHGEKSKMCQFQWKNCFYIMLNQSNWYLLNIWSQENHIVIPNRFVFKSILEAFLWIWYGLKFPFSNVHLFLVFIPIPHPQFNINSFRFFAVTSETWSK